MDRFPIGVVGQRQPGFQPPVEDIRYFLDPHDGDQIAGAAGDGQVGLAQRDPAGRAAGLDRICLDPAHPCCFGDGRAELRLYPKGAAERVGDIQRANALPRDRP